MQASIIATLIIAIAATHNAQAQSYQWEDDFCEYKGDFNNKKYSAKQIENSHLILNRLNGLNLSSFFPPMTIDALDKLSTKDMDILTQEYNQVKNQIKQFDVVPEARSYQQELLKTVDGEYQVNQLTILAYLNPSAALKQSPQMCKNYIEPLLQSDMAVQSRWKQFVEEGIQEQAQYGAEQAKSYRSSATLRYQEQKASNPAKYAKINLITFGFGNCVNAQSYRTDSEVVFTNLQQLNETLFGKSFAQMCYEP